MNCARQMRTRTIQGLVAVRRTVELLLFTRGNISIGEVNVSIFLHSTQIYALCSNGARMGGMVEQATGLRERKKRQTREALTRAALELFAERGYDETTLADIADAAGYGNPAYFDYPPTNRIARILTITAAHTVRAPSSTD